MWAPADREGKYRGQYHANQFKSTYRRTAIWDDRQEASSGKEEREVRQVLGSFRLST